MIHLENEDNVRAFLEEVVLPEKETVLTSKRYVTTATGTILRETRVAFCDRCGYRLDSDKVTIICCICRRKLCDSPRCAIYYRGRHYCENDLQQILPLNRLQFKIIHGLSNNLELDKIKELARSKDGEFHLAINALRHHNYIDKKGVSLFSHYEVLEHGILAWRTYHKAFSDADVAYFGYEVENHLKEVNRTDSKNRGRENR